MADLLASPSGAALQRRLASLIGFLRHAGHVRRLTLRQVSGASTSTSVATEATRTSVLYWGRLGCSLGPLPILSADAGRHARGGRAIDALANRGWLVTPLVRLNLHVLFSEEQEQYQRVVVLLRHHRHSLQYLRLIVTCDSDALDSDALDDPSSSPLGYTHSLMRAVVCMPALKT